MTTEKRDPPPCSETIPQNGEENDAKTTLTPHDIGMLCASTATFVTIHSPRPSSEVHIAKFRLRAERTILEITGGLHDGACALTVRMECGKVLLESYRHGTQVRIKDLRDETTMELRRTKSKKRDGATAELSRAGECLVKIRANVMTQKVLVDDVWFGLRLATIRKTFPGGFKLSGKSPTSVGVAFRIKVHPTVDIALMVLLVFAFDALVAGAV